MNKKCELRKHAKSIRQSSNNNSRLSKSIVERLKTLDIYKNAKNILTYSPIDNEIDLTLINFCEGKKWIFPKVESETLETYLVEAFLDLKKGSFNVLEPFECGKFNPKEIELAIIPALMVDLKGHRLGYGKGFYDRFIPKLNPSCTKIVLIQDALIVESLPINEFDKEVDFILSEKRFIKTS